MKNNTSGDVGHAALMMYPGILEAGRNAQNMIFLNWLISLKMKVKVKNDNNKFDYLVVNIWLLFLLFLLFLKICRFKTEN